MIDHNYSSMILENNEEARLSKKTEKLQKFANDIAFLKIDLYPKAWAYGILFYFIYEKFKAKEDPDST